ncbi:MFS transporter [Conexibacter woesei]|uniref:Major facilitator superfamily MFS_1 n=1 Tax=Conexibacter woesei (strain DSM 14684 / CCUG 47730 / CIP 108061 / JCM 11494 / NBRC 100937 / ID131577) TaxID=469383 RepID=D3F5B2_CONWI|nr:MFS transporter [Conexibacter woesei]ADB50579.1 major facilitator superfamily MFS_1 [Conexibacter woesei DSM 14684]
MRSRPPLPQRPRAALAAACLASATTVGFIVCAPPALPSLQRELGASFEQQQWIVNGYVLTQAALLVTAGSLGDRRGHRRIFLTGMTAYAALLVAFACAPSALALALLGALAGAASALALGATLPIVSLAYPDARRRHAALAVWGVSVALAYAAGPPLGGLLAEHVGWRAVFAALAAPTALGALLALRSVPARGPRDARLDPLGALLLAAGLGAALFALIEGNRLGWSSAAIVAACAGAIVLLAAFAAWERRASAPLLDPRTTGEPVLQAAALATLALSAALFAMVFYLPRYLMAVLDAGPAAAGAGLLGVTVPAVLAAVAGLRLRGRVPELRLVVGSLAALAVGAALTAQLAAAASYPALLPGLVVFGLGVGTINGPLAALVAQVAGRTRSGAANAAVYLCRPAGAAAGIAGLGALLQLRAGGDGRSVATAAASAADVQALVGGVETVFHAVAAAALLAAVAVTSLLRRA